MPANYPQGQVNDTTEEFRKKIAEIMMAFMAPYADSDNPGKYRMLPNIKECVQKINDCIQDTFGYTLWAHLNVITNQMPRWFSFGNPLRSLRSKIKEQLKAYPQSQLLLSDYKKLERVKNDLEQRLKANEAERNQLKQENERNDSLSTDLQHLQEKEKGKASYYEKEYNELTSKFLLFNTKVTEFTMNLKSSNNSAPALLTSVSELENSFKLLQTKLIELQVKLEEKERALSLTNKQLTEYESLLAITTFSYKETLAELEKYKSEKKQNDPDLTKVVISAKTAQLDLDAVSADKGDNNVSIPRLLHP